MLDRTIGGGIRGVKPEDTHVASGLSPKGGFADSNLATPVLRVCCVGFSAGPILAKNLSVGQVAVAAVAP
jgi:hypothetical protein